MREKLFVHYLSSNELSKITVTALSFDTTLHAAQLPRPRRSTTLRISETDLEAMRAYAPTDENKQLEVDASGIRFRAERRIGKLMEAQKDTIGLNDGSRWVGRSQTRHSHRSINKHLADRAFTNASRYGTGAQKKPPLMAPAKARSFPRIERPPKLAERVAFHVRSSPTQWMIIGRYS
ncbi:hypothetical protein SAMN05444321_7887 [Bradyrhizobium lablabi]|nr:hypothetical protein SAMN05444321_7887 [Bradyrhizobium lablabi]